MDIQALREDLLRNQSVIRQQKRRLHLLEEKVALFGLQTEPSTVLEIQQIKVKLKSFYEIDTLLCDMEILADRYFRLQERTSARLEAIKEIISRLEDDTEIDHDVRYRIRNFADEATELSLEMIQVIDNFVEVRQRYRNIETASESWFGGE